MTRTASALIFGEGRLRTAWGLALALAALLPADARAQVLDAAGLEALAGRGTLHFVGPDGAYGAEQFLPGRRSLWRFAGSQTCQSGHWYERGPAICFLYEGEPAPSCWILEKIGAGVIARSEGGGPDATLSLERIDPAPLPCPLTGAGS
mgnify:CR=1 FL=1